MEPRTESQPEPEPPLKPPLEFYDPDDAEGSCYSCGNPRFRVVRDSECYGFPIRFQECACGIVKQTPMPNEKFFQWFFNSPVFMSSRRTGVNRIWGFYDYLADEDCRLATSRLRYRRLSRYLEAGRKLRILKIGPSTGTFLHVAAQHGHEVRGCDVSRQFVDYAREKYSVTIDHGRFERLGYPDASFDLILLFNVIENVPNQDEFLRAIARCLKPGGHFLVNYVELRGNLLERLQGERYFLYRPPICYGFTGSALDRILDERGMTVVERFRDIRVMHVEKIATLLGWRWPVALTRWAGLHRMPFRVYAYPSRIVVARRL